jgi:hypothetical protein
MASSGMLRRVAVVRNDVSEDLNSSIIRVTRIDELGTYTQVFLRCVLLVTANVVPSSSILVTLMMEALSSTETSVLTRATLHNIPEDAVSHSHRREKLKSYVVALFCSSVDGPGYDLSDVTRATFVTFYNSSFILYPTSYRHPGHQTGYCAMFGCVQFCSVIRFSCPLFSQLETARDRSSARTNLGFPHP